MPKIVGTWNVGHRMDGLNVLDVLIDHAMIYNAMQRHRKRPLLVSKKGNQNLNKTSVEPKKRHLFFGRFFNQIFS